MADSWKTDGNCAECRRKSYCGHACNAHKNAIENLSWLDKVGHTKEIREAMYGQLQEA